MNKIIICLLFVVAFHVGYAQGTKVLIEVGGAYGHTSSSQPFNTITTQTQEMKSPKLQTQIGLGVSSHSYIGLSYNLTKHIDINTSTTTNETYRSSKRNERSEKIDAFGVFYRYYFLPFNKNRWNIFAEVNPSYQLYKIDGKEESESVYLETNEVRAISYMIWSRRQKALDFDVKVGGSYRITNNFRAQLSMRSLANINYTFGNSYAVPDDQKKISYQFFLSPLSNTYLSLLFNL